MVFNLETLDCSSVTAQTANFSAREQVPNSGLGIFLRGGDKGPIRFGEVQVRDGRGVAIKSLCVGWVLFLFSESTRAAHHECNTRRQFVMFRRQERGPSPSSGARR